jgi:hypothetical protein
MRIAVKLAAFFATFIISIYFSEAGEGVQLDGPERSRMGYTRGNREEFKYSSYLFSISVFPLD